MDTARRARRAGVVVALALLYALAAWLMLSPNEAEAHDLGLRTGSVIKDSLGGHLVWRDNTRYEVFVQNAGNYTNGWGELDCRWGWLGGDHCAGVQIGYGSPYSIRYNDYYDCSSGYVALTYIRSGAVDDTYFNVCHMDNYSFNSKWGVATHEMGHALGFAHPPCTSYYYDNSIMVSGRSCRGWITPRPHDDSDYFYKFVRGRGAYS